MITSATQLKAKIRNVSGGDSMTAMVMMRTFFMEEDDHRDIFMNEEIIP